MSEQDTPDQSQPQPSLDTDDLDVFSNLFEGRESPQPEEEKVEDNEPSEKPEAEDAEAEEPEKSEAEDEAKDETEESKDSEEKPRKKPSYQERINQLTAKAREAERAKEALEARVAELEKATSQSKPTEQTSSTPSVPVPTPEDKNPDGSDKYPLGEFDPQYIRDLNRAIIEEEWARKKAEEEKTFREQQEEKARQALDSQWQERVKPALAEYDDFVEKTLDLEDTFKDLDSGYSEYLVSVIKSLDNGPEVLYYFASDLDKARELVRSGPLAATLALGEVNALFKKQPSPKKEIKVSKAPPPPQVGKGATPRVSIAPDTDDLDAFSKLFEKA